MSRLLLFSVQVAYNLFFSVFFIITGPYFLLRLWRRGKLLPRFEQRFGMYSSGTRRALAPGADVWIHAVSVGEVKIAMVVLRRLRAMNPDLRAVITTTTATGFALASSRLEDTQTHILYNPIDFLWSVARAFDLIRPKQLLLVESEIWPNYLWCARRRKIPVFLINARLSERTESRYRKIRWVLRPLLDELTLVFAQDETEVERLTLAGFPAERIFNAGCLKYEVATLNDYEKVNLSWWNNLHWPKEALIIMGGSTHPGEEQILVNIFKELQDEFPLLRLVLVPRHMERGHEVRDLCRKSGVEPVMRSQLASDENGHSNGNGTGESRPPVLIVDSTGEMLALYSRAGIVFVGKSVCGKGGQNFVEAAPSSAAIVAGPQLQNFLVPLRDFRSAQAIAQMDPGDLDTVVNQLADKLRSLVSNPTERIALGHRAKTLFDTKRDSARPTAEMIFESLRRCS